MPEISHQSKIFIFSSLLAAALALSALAQETNQPAKTETRQSSQFEVMAKGILTTPPLKIQFKSAALFVEIRNLVMGRGETESIQTPTRVLFELRQGEVTTITDQNAQQRHQGEFWTMDKDASFKIRNSGEVAVLRAIYLFEGRR